MSVINTRFTLSQTVERLALLALVFMPAACQQTDTISSTPSQAEPPTRLFLQQLGHDSVIIKWRGEAEQVCLVSARGKDQQCLDSNVKEDGHRIVQFTGLRSDSEYRYRVGGFTKELVFRTAPAPGELPKDGTVRLWILGDSGTASERDDKGVLRHPGEAAAVMQGFLQYNETAKGDPLDMILLLGDNAYLAGTDAQWQESVFDLYLPQIYQSALWPTIGNHEMGFGVVEHPKYGKLNYGGVSISADPNSYWTLEGNGESTQPSRMPYLNIFTLPTRAELGGVPSGTEQYYSVNYGNIHLVSLDSQLSARDVTQRAAMKEWLIADLAANQQDWTIVIFHHPPYTRGSHNSDEGPSSMAGIDLPIIDMRREFTPVFEDYGVDLVYTGHSHSYERSWYLHGHRGDAATFDASMHAELNADGQPLTGRDDQFYSQISTGSGIDDKVVYTVAGSSGKVALEGGKLDHPANAIQPSDPEQRNGLAELGSVIVDAEQEQLTARFINDKGEVLDTVILRR